MSPCTLSGTALGLLCQAQNEASETIPLGLSDAQSGQQHCTQQLSCDGLGLAVQPGSGRSWAALLT